jgi:hypothetical protein
MVIALPLYQDVVRPVIDKTFSEFEVDAKELDPLTIGDTIEKINEADLVIASLQGFPEEIINGFASRQLIGLPTVLMAATGVKLSANEAELRHLTFDQNADVDINRGALTREIERVLQPYAPATMTKGKLELAQRVITVADAIANLRINSLGDYVQELRGIGQQIRELPDEAGGLNELSVRALRIVANLFDALGTEQGAQVIIAGAAAGILGAGGWSSAVIFGLTLAAWKGKDAFMAALENSTRRRGEP